MILYLNVMEIVTAKKLSKYFGALKAVDNIDFSIREGECFGFLGPNGAGKTTVMKIIHCFMPPTSGEIRVFDIDVKENPAEIKSRIGVMPQDDNLDPDLTVYENLIVYARYFDITGKKASEIANKLIKSVNLEEKRDVNIRELSGGMKHKLLLIRALINEPELLILDEPTTGLDPHSRRSVWERLDQLKFENVTLILTTHYMEEAERLCDRVAILDSGRIVTVDTPSSLMERYGGNLEDVYIKLTGRHLYERVL